MRLTASPWKIGSASMTALPTMTAAAVSSMGRKRTTPASSTASARGIPSLSFSSMKSTRMMLFRRMIPAPAMKPIMLVAVKKVPTRAWAGRMPMSDSGMGTRITRGIRKLSNQPTTRT